MVNTVKVMSVSPILKKMLGFIPAMVIKRDESCMRQYLNKVSPNGLQDPKLGQFCDYMPAGGPLLDFLYVYQENMGAWKYPKREEKEI